MKKLAIFTGAGISEESNLSTFRDSNGLWNKHAVEEVASVAGWKRNPQKVIQFYNDRRKQVLAAKPNYAHVRLVDLEKYFSVHIITQNVDDLHERAGSKQVCHLHGEILKMRSEKNPYKSFRVEKDICYGDKAEDGGLLRPDVVWFEEPVYLFNKAQNIVDDADILVVIGTSLVVYPANLLLHNTVRNIPIYIIDKNIPYENLTLRSNITVINKKATEGVEDLFKYLGIEQQ
ncbi:MAG: Sir2 family NAD-dependent protein deacetylase [Phycisphaerales bacterium]|nr:Sir2 family NAD-dependent protein deacetylase [Phycisphaerales bacterium]